MDWAVWRNPIYTALAIILWAAWLWLMVNRLRPFAESVVKRAEDDSLPLLPFPFKASLVLVVLLVWLGFFSTVGQWALRPQNTLEISPVREQRLDSLDRRVFDEVDSPAPSIDQESEQRIEDNRESNEERKSKFQDLKK